MLDVLRAGGSGCISATANISPASIAGLAADWTNNNAEKQQQALNTLRDLFEKYPMISAMKSVTAHYSGISDWRRVRPPLVELNEKSEISLLEELESMGFVMDKLEEVNRGGDLM